MKVKELIEHLQQLDQERNIWLVYDSFSAYEPEVEIVNEGTSSVSFDYIRKHNGVKEGDYAMIVG